LDKIRNAPAVYKAQIHAMYQLFKRDLSGINIVIRGKIPRHITIISWSTLLIMCWWVPAYKSLSTSILWKRRFKRDLSGINIVIPEDFECRKIRTIATPKIKLSNQDQPRVTLSFIYDEVALN
jgi:hypothetical protein